MLEPPPDSLVAAYEIPPEELIQDSDGTLRLAFPDTRETTLFVHAGDAPTTALAAQIRLSRTSRIAGQPAVVEVLATTPEAAAVARTNVGAVHEIAASPSPPSDEEYLPLLLENVELSDDLDLPLVRPNEVIAGTLFEVSGPAIKTRIQGAMTDGSAVTTVSRPPPGDSFELRAVTVAGDWRIGAEVTFVDPADVESDLPNLTVSFETDLACQTTPCALNLPAIDSGTILPEPRRYTVAVTGVDAGGISSGVSGVRVEFHADVDVPLGLARATISAEAVTQKDGTATVYLLDGHDYTVGLHPGGTGFASELFALAVPEDTLGDLLSFELELGVRLDGTIVAANPTDDSPGVAGVVVRPQPSPGPGAPSAGGGVTTTPITDDQGAFSLRLDPGVYDLDLTPPEGSGYPRWSADNVEALEDTSGLHVVLPDGVSIPVHVRAQGTPIAGATVHVVALSDTGDRPPRERALATTDKSGNATLLLPSP